MRKAFKVKTNPFQTPSEQHLLGWERAPESVWRRFWWANCCLLAASRNAQRLAKLSRQGLGGQSHHLFWALFLALATSPGPPARCLERFWQGNCLCSCWCPEVHQKGLPSYPWLPQGLLGRVWEGQSSICFGDLILAPATAPWAKRSPQKRFGGVWNGNCFVLLLASTTPKRGLQSHLVGLLPGPPFSTLPAQTSPESQQEESPPTEYRGYSSVARAFCTCRGLSYGVTVQKGPSFNP